jgi:predicted O-methyltransferase YrrM
VPHIRNDGLNLPQTALSEIESLVLERQAAGKVVLELGAEWGYSTLLMARVAKKIISVDWHQGYDFQRQDTLIQYFYNIKAERDKIVPVVGKFEDILPLFADHSFDFIFQDGGHDFESTLFNFRQCFRLCKPGGVIATHDFGHPSCSEKMVLEMLGVKVRNPVVGTMALMDCPQVLNESHLPEPIR